jgi:hypothetical protein
VKLRSVAAVIGRSLGGVAGFDLVQRRQTIFRNFPIIGHLRFIHEGVGPALSTVRHSGHHRRADPIRNEPPTEHR